MNIIENAKNTAVKNRGEWNIETFKFFTMGLTSLAIAGISPALAPVFIAIAVPTAIAVIGSGYMAQKNQNAIKTLSENPPYTSEVQSIVENISGLSKNLSIGTITSTIKAMRESSLNTTQNKIYPK